MFLFLIPFVNDAQERGIRCPIDSTKWLTLIHGVGISDTGLVLSTGLTYEATDSETEQDGCRGYTVLYSDSAQQFYVVEDYWDIKAETSVRRFVSWVDLKKIRTLEIDVYMVSEFPLKTIDLSKLDFAKNLKSLPNLENILVKDGQGTFQPISLNFSKWAIYKELVKQNSLLSFREHFVFAYAIDLNTHTDLQPFTSLKLLELPYNINEKLSNFQQLETVIIPDVSTFFTHSLATLPNLKSIYGLGYKKPSYSSDVFFANILSIKDTSHILHLVDNELHRLLIESQKINGFYALNRNQLSGRLELVSGEFDSLKTIAYGEIKEGKTIGVWKLRRLNGYSSDFYFYDYNNQQQVRFPENGVWNYYYPNGILAIQGTFKKAKKHGVWKFYDITGKLQDTKTFKKDQAHGLFVNNSWPDEESFSVDARSTYYLDNSDYYYFKDDVLYHKSKFGFESSKESKRIHRKMKYYRKQLDIVKL